MSAGAGDLLEALATRDTLEDERLFVPRAYVMNKLQGLGRTIKSVWLWGPRRVGKSTLAGRLARRAEDRGIRTVTVDASTITSFADLACCLLQGMGLADPKRGRDVVARFAEEGARGSGEAVLLVIDEADRLALSLGQEEQNVLRSRATQGRYRYVFVSHVDPARLVEECPDVTSRLLGITTSQRVGVFERGDVERLCSELEGRLGIEGLGGIAGRVWDEVGGHPVSVMTVVHEVALSGLASPDSVDDAFDRARAVLVNQMRGLWGDLSPGTRTLLQDPSAIEDQFCRSEARADGLYLPSEGIVWPRLLQEAAKRSLPGCREGDDPAECWILVCDLQDRVAEINATAKAKLGRGWFDTTDETRRGRVAARASASEAEFKAVVDHLSKVLFENARERDPNRGPEGDPMRWRVPEEFCAVYARHAAIKALRTLRNFFDHDPDVGRSIEERADKYERAAEVFSRLCGESRPFMAEQWARAHRSLLVEAIAALDKLLGALRAGPLALSRG